MNRNDGDRDELEEWLQHCAQSYLERARERLDAYRRGESPREPDALALRVLANPGRFGIRESRPASRRWVAVCSRCDRRFTAAELRRSGADARRGLPCGCAHKAVA